MRKSNLLLLFIGLLFINTTEAQVGFKRKEKQVQLLYGFEYQKINSFLRNDYYLYKANLNNYHLTANVKCRNSYLSLGLGNQHINGELRLLAPINIGIPFTKIQFSPIKIGLLGGYRIDINKNHYKPIINTPEKGTSTGIKVIDNLTQKAVDLVAFPKAKETRKAFYYGIVTEIPIRLGDHLYLVPNANLAFQKLNLMNISYGCRVLYSIKETNSKIKQFKRR